MILIYSIAIPKLRSFSINKEKNVAFTSRTKRQKGNLQAEALIRLLFITTEFGTVLKEGWTSWNGNVFPPPRGLHHSPSSLLIVSPLTSIMSYVHMAWRSLICNADLMIFFADLCSIDWLVGDNAS